MIRRTYTARGRHQSGVFSIEGTRLIERALRAAAPLTAILVAVRFVHSDDPRKRRILDELKAIDCPVTVAADETVAELTEGRDLGQILGLVRLPPPVELSSLLSTRPLPGAKDNPGTNPKLFLAAADIADPGNVGALTRTAHAGSATALLTAGANDPYHPRATRISRGSIFKLPTLQYKTTEEMLTELRRNNVTIIGTSAGKAIPLPEFQWPALPTAILMGNEAEGLPSSVQTILDHVITIPMPPGVDSWSVNAAAAIILYAASQSISI